MTPALSFNVFDAPGKPLVGDRPRPFGPPLAWDPMTSTLIYGENDAVLVDPLTTVAEAEALAAWVRLHHRNLTLIYITHGHLDHFAGLSVLLRHFPGARAIATPKSVELAREQPVAFDRKLLPGQLPAAITVPDPYPEKVFYLEGHELRIIEQGHTDAPDSTSLYVPSIDLVVGGNVLYNQCHQYVAKLTPEIRENWIAALDRLSALNPTTAVAGHKKPGAADTPEAIVWTKRYLTDFGRLKEETSIDRELFDAMGQLYPGWAAHQAWLMFGLASTAHTQVFTGNDAEAGGPGLSYGKRTHLRKDQKMNANNQGTPVSGLTDKIRHGVNNPLISTDFDFTAVLDDVLGTVGLSVQDAGGNVRFYGGADPLIASPFFFASAAAVALGAKGVAASAVWRDRGGAVTTILKGTAPGLPDS